MKINRSIVATVSALTCALLLGVSAPSHAAEASKKSTTHAASPALVAPVNINTANVDVLATLNGIGEKKAAEIVAYREANGKFSKVEDLLNVKGIGEKTLEKNRPHLSVN